MSDRVVEAEDPNQAMYGFERLKQAIAYGLIDSAGAMLDHLVREGILFLDETEPQDDFTIADMRI